MTRATRLLVCLCFGVATTVAVAWASGAWARIHPWDEVRRGRTTEDGSGWFVIRYRQPGADCALGRPLAAMAEGAEHLAAWPGAGPGQWDPPGAGAPAIRLVCRRGWPMVALECQVSGEAPARVSGGYALNLDRPAPPRGGAATLADIAVLPAIPVLPGFAIDTILFAAAWWLAAAGARRARRRAECVTWRVAAAAFALCVGLGAVTTVLVAWSCALLVGEHGDDQGPDQVGTAVLDDGNWIVTIFSNSGAARIYSDWERGQRPWGSGKAAALVAPWGDELLPDSGSGRRVLDARGWPMLAMWGSFAVERPRGAPIDVHRGVALPREDTHAVRDDWTRLIPLAPIWPGFAVDTLFYAGASGALLLLVVGPGAWRRALRRRGGRCLRCAYDLRGIPGGACPECGAAHGANST